jgi:hypothetical protein
VIATPCVAFSVCVVGEIAAANGSVTVIETVAVAVPVTDPVAVIVTEEVAAIAVGIPEIAPVAVSKVSPAVNVPLVIAYETVPENPVGAKSAVGTTETSFAPIRFWVLGDNEGATITETEIGPTTADAGLTTAAELVATTST